ncbi:hypothetical protein ACFO3U_02210 [Flavobacterium ponti]|uniref:Uncharacterized protein n=1 Tax=Flavobacterium ponti TaxID=665133 RepID=A0ABV9P3N5_9FLAO
MIAIFIILSPFLYFFFKKSGKKRTGLILSLFFISIAIIPVIFLYFESKFYFKSDAINDLKIVEITLNENFEIIENKITGLAEYYQTTKLKISKNDKERIINEISNSVDFFVYDKYNFLKDSNNNKESSKIIAHYSFGEKYIKESYEKKNGFAPVLVMIILNEKSNILEVRRIED